MTIVWSDESRRSLRAIRRFIAMDSDFYAARMVERIVSRVEQVALGPAQGHRVHEYPEAPLREVHVAPYRIIYRLSGTELEVVTVVHFKQQLSEDKLRK